MDFPMDFLLFLMCFINVCKHLLFILNFTKVFFIKDNLQKHLVS
jgi:hypothetical protein